MLMLLLMNFAIYAAVSVQATQSILHRPGGAELVDCAAFARASAGKPILRIISLNVTTREVGDAHLIVTPGGKVILIDTGMPGYGNSVILPYLRRHGIGHIDWMMASHMHDDHFGSMPELILSNQITVGEVLWSPLPADRMHKLEEMYAADSVRIMKQIRAACAQRNVPIREIVAGQMLDLGDGVTGQVLAAAEPQITVGNYINNNSIIMMLRHGQFSMLFTGDQGFEEEDRVMALGKDLVCDVLKIGHHAGAGSTSEKWVAALRPKVGIASMAEYLSNDPRGRRVYDLLMPTGIRYLRTWECGHIEIQTDGKHFATFMQHPLSAGAPELGR